ncbi:MAG TPA: hypothetical protein VM370_07775 [Candidatus Thermoplasmatota archaeon]|nr:hypothetical protein [Candidatus Thermoplasmatota archaeon]
MMRAVLGTMVLLLLPVALGDHVYSHRFVFDGRLVGADGAPLPGRQIQFFSEGQDFLETCREGQRVVTDEFGDFHFCYHVHDLDPATRVGVRAGNASATRPIDIAMRRSFVLLREPNETGLVPPGWNESYRISGRAWRPGATTLEGVPVYGEAVAALPINLTIKVPGQEDSVFHTMTDGYGDFDLVLETVANASALSLSLEAMGRGQPVQADAFFHRSYAPVYVANAQPPAKAPVAGAFDAPPGSATPRASPLLAVALAVGIVLALWFAGGRRKSS